MTYEFEKEVIRMRRSLDVWRGNSWNPSRELSPWFQDMEELLGDFFAPLATRRETGMGFTPAVDIEETDSHYLMSVDLPGVSKDDVKIDVIENQLTVSGERKFERKADEKNRHFVERSYGQFQRSFTLPAGIDADKIEADFRDGVLHIAVSKAEAVKPRQVKISESKTKQH